MTVITSMESVVTVAERKTEQVESSDVVSWFSSNWRKLAAEATATFLLLFLGCASCIPIDGIDPMPPTYVPLAFGFVIAINTQIFGHISGAHTNPCITLLSVFWGNMSIMLGICYFISQFLGSVFATWLLSNLSPMDFVGEAVCTTQPHERLYLWQAVIIEMVLTCTLCLINCSLWDPVNKKKQESSAIKFGLTIAGLSFAGGPLTGASLNPVRSLGPALVTGTWNGLWVYWTGPFLGAFIACIYKLVWLEKSKKPED